MLLFRQMMSVLLLVFALTHSGNSVADDKERNKRPFFPFQQSDCADLFRGINPLLDSSFFRETSRPHKNFTDAPARSYEEVKAAFSPIDGSQTAQYADLDLFSSEAKSLWNRIPQRKAESDMMAAKLVAGKIDEYKKLGGLVFIDSGGAHSVAISVELAKQGYQPILKMNRNSGTGDAWIQEIGAMKYYTPEMEKAKAGLSPESPPAFIMDAHRGSSMKDGKLITFPEYPPNSLPSVEEVKSKYRGRVIWITEGSYTANELKKRDDHTPKIFSHYREVGIEFYQHFASPYYDNTPAHSIRLLKEDEVPKEEQ